MKWSIGVLLIGIVIVGCGDDGSTKPKKNEGCYDASCPVNAEDVMLVKAKVKSAREMSRDGEEQAILIQYPGGNRTFEEVSVLFSSIEEARQNESYWCFAPLPDLPGEKRRKLRSTLKSLFVNELEKRLEEAPAGGV